MATNNVEHVEGSYFCHHHTLVVMVICLIHVETAWVCNEFGCLKLRCRYERRYVTSKCPSLEECKAMSVVFNSG